MVAPLVGIAAAAAAKLVAKKLAQNAAKKTVKKTVKKLAEPKSAVKVVPKKDMTTRVVDNMNATDRAEWIKSGNIARGAANSVNIGKPKTTVKIKSGGNIKPASSLKGRLASYTPNPGRLPNLIKIDSAKGSTVKKTAYRPNKRTSK